MDKNLVFMMGFPFMYSSIKKFSMDDDLSCEDLLKKGGKTGKLIGEFFAANGSKSIPVSVLSETISIVDNCLEAGQLNTEKSLEIRQRIENEILPTISEIFKPSFDESNENADEMPLVLFVFSYASMVLEELGNISKENDYPTRFNRINLLREGIGLNRKKFPRPHL